MNQLEIFKACILTQPLAWEALILIHTVTQHRMGPHTRQIPYIYTADALHIPGSTQPANPHTESQSLYTVLSYSPPLTWHIWSHKKVLYYPNVILYIIWHFGLKYCVVEVFQENGLFQCVMLCLHTQWKYISMKEICSQCHTIWN